MKRVLAFVAVLTLAGCASIPPKNQPAPASSAVDDCHCDTPSEELHGIPFKGRIVAILSDRLRMSYGEIPGAMPAGTREFKAAPEVLAAVQPGREILARIEQRNSEWWLFDVRLLIPLRAAP
jgi:hypothetical protein